jgi:hypothetical protein
VCSQFIKKVKRNLLLFTVIFCGIFATAVKVSKETKENKSPYLNFVYLNTMKVKILAYNNRIRMTIHHTPHSTKWLS